MSATFADDVTLGSSTALMVAPAKEWLPRVSQREFLVVLEHPRAPAARGLRHFLHRDRTLPRLQVGDEHFGARAHLLELRGEHVRAEVLGGDRDVALLVRERRLD